MSERLGLSAGESSLFASIHLTLCWYVTRKKETLLFFEIIRSHSSPFEALFFVDHLLKESKEQPEKVRPFIAELPRAR